MKGQRRLIHMNTYKIHNILSHMNGIQIVTRMHPQQLFKISVIKGGGNYRNNENQMLI
jgi:hypothetical protein